MLLVDFVSIRSHYFGLLVGLGKMRLLRLPTSGASTEATDRVKDRVNVGVPKT